MDSKIKVSACTKIMSSRMLNMVLLCLFVLCAGIYNYGLHTSFWGGYEYVLPIYRRFLKESYGINMNLSGIYDIFTYIPYKLFGCSLKADRVYSVIFYQLIMVFCTITAIYSFERKKFEWYKLGIFAFIAVILHPGSSPYLGQHFSTQHQYPYDYHVFTVIFATISVMLLCVHQGITERKYRNILKMIILAVIVVGYKKTDFLYIIGFIGPLICVGLLYLWKDKRKLFFALAFGGIGALALLHAVSFVVPSLASLFVQPSLGYATWKDGSTVYGNRGFAELSKIDRYASNTAARFLALFNIDISGKSMLSIGTILAGFRLILVIFMFCCSFKILIDAIRKEKDYKSIDPINIVLALGILFNFFIIMFSGYGNEGRCNRYMSLTVFYGAILLARQSENIITKLYGEVDSRSKLYFFLFFSFMIVANMVVFWKADDHVEDYESAMRNVTSLIKDMDMGNGLGDYRSAARLTLLGEGNYAVVRGMSAKKGFGLTDTGGAREMPIVFNYIVDWPDVQTYFDADLVYQHLGEPDEVYEIDGFVIYYYQEGFTISRIGTSNFFTVN